jgi:serine/threonine-protein kinase
VHVDDIADAILDGTPIDWTRLAADGSPVDDALIQQLKALAAVKFLNRTGAEQDGAGFSWGPLQVFEPIGRGAFGEVFRAWDTRLDREVALKLLSGKGSAGVSPASVIEEGRLLARVHHPNVVTVHGAERIGGQVGLWMELVKGRTLEDLLRERTHFTAKQTVSVGVELARAVSAVHAAGLLHRDIKSQNVMVADNGRLVLMDFGTGREVADTPEVNVTGTPLYLAPEVLSGGTASVQSDVYSIGVLLYHLLTGAYPVQARDLAELRRRHAMRGRTDLRRSRPDIPKRLARIIERACDPEPDDRYASADALADALAALADMPRSVRRAYAVAAALAAVSAGVILWEFVPRLGLRMASPPAAAAARETRPGIAVLPFRNLGAEDDGEFVDGLTTELARNLTALGLPLRSQTSSFTFKGKPRDLRAIAAGLGVDLIVEGEVLRVGDRLRVNARLVQAGDDVRLWSETFDRGITDVFEIQNEISSRIAEKLGVPLRRAQRQWHTQPDTYELYLRARSLVVKAGIDNAFRAAPLFEQVIARDPAFAPAYAGAADAYALMSWQIESSDGTPAIPNDEAVRRMRPAAEKALALDPQLAEAHAAMGHTYARERDWVNATRSFERAVALDPTVTHIQTNYTHSVLLPLGKAPDAVRLLEAAFEADPLSLDVRRSLAFSQIVVGQYDAAIEHLRHVLSIDPDFPHASLSLARALTFSGRLDEAQGIWSTRQRPVWAAHTYVRTGQRADVERLLATTDHPYRRAILFAALGDKDRTFEALDRAIGVLPQRTALLLVQPEMAFLQGDPRLILLRKKLNMP